MHSLPVKFVKMVYSESQTEQVDENPEHVEHIVSVGALGVKCYCYYSDILNVIFFTQPLFYARKKVCNFLFKKLATKHCN